MPIPAKKAERLNEVYNFLTGFLDESKKTETVYLTLKDGSTRLFRGEPLDIGDVGQVPSQTRSSSPSSASSEDGSIPLSGLQMPDGTQSELGITGIPNTINADQRRASFGRKTLRKSSRLGKNRRQSHRKNRK